MGPETLIRWIEDRAESTPYGLAVLRRDKLVAEHYGSGAGPDSRWDIGSIRKSVNCALAGLAIEAGMIALETPAHQKWPEIVALSGQEADREITLHHLLSSTSGWLAPETPGTRFRYNNSAFTAAERVVARSLGLAADEVAPEAVARLAAPLGLATWKVSHRGADFDPAHHGDPGPKLLIESTVRDLLRWGELWLRGGHWEGKQLIPAGHVRRATRRTNPDLTDSHYGYCWFVNAERALWTAVPEDSFGHPGNGYYMATGDASRAFLWVCPSLDTVAVVCTDPRTGLTLDYLEAPMATTGEWLDLVVRLVSAAT